MRAGLHVITVGHMSNFQPLGNAATTATVRLHDRNTVGRNVVLELLSCKQRFPQGDRDGCMRFHLCMTKNILSRKGLLKPEEVEFFPHAGALNGFGMREALIGIDHERPIRPKYLPHGGNALSVFCWII